LNSKKEILEKTVTTILSVSGGHRQNDSLAAPPPPQLDVQRDEPALPAISTYICVQAYIQHIVRCFSQFERGTITIGV